MDTRCIRVCAAQIGGVVVTLSAHVAVIDTLVLDNLSSFEFLLRKSLPAYPAESVLRTVKPCSAAVATCLRSPPLTLDKVEVAGRRSGCVSALWLLQHCLRY